MMTTQTRMMTIGDAAPKSNKRQLLQIFEVICPGEKIVKEITFKKVLTNAV